MKKIFLLLIIVVSYSGIYAQNDSIYFWKSGVLLEMRSIKTADLDSITFKRPTPIITPNQVTICSQVWATKNLEVTTYSDGTPIPQVTDPTQWENLTTGAWCYYNNDPANGAVYGKLYNWYAAAGIYDAASEANPALRKKLAPAGWHVPSFPEWTQLTDCLGGPSVAGGKMKSIGTLQAGTSLWQSPNTEATNASGFTGLPAGYRDFFGSFDDIGYYGYWWSSSESDTADAWGRVLRYYDGYANGVNASKIIGFSLRCLRD